MLIKQNMSPIGNLLEIIAGYGNIGIKISDLEYEYYPMFKIPGYEYLNPSNLLRFLLKKNLVNKCVSKIKLPNNCFNPMLLRRYEDIYKINFKGMWVINTNQIDSYSSQLEREAYHYFRNVNKKC